MSIGDKILEVNVLNFIAAINYLFSMYNDSGQNSSAISITYFISLLFLVKCSIKFFFIKTLCNFEFYSKSVRYFTKTFKT